MWLLPLFPRLARGVASVFYRMRYGGGTVPRTGPVLLVANHPNSLLDPTVVVAAARRPVRFLAKAPLFSDKLIGWLVRASGAIPVYRRVDDPSQVGRNDDTFNAVHAALRDGAAVGIFPEGTSHSEPALVPLKTGAARIALGGAEQVGGAFPIVPVGLHFRTKDVFRSEAIAVVGKPVEWSDLVTFDGTSVRELTRRIDAALRQVTLNLEQWEDRPLVDGAVRIWEAERKEPPGAAERVARLDITTRILAEARRSHDEPALELANDIGNHCRRLKRLRLRPADLGADVRLSRGVRWAATRLHLFLPLALALWVAATALFWIPYQLVAFILRRLPLEQDVRSTWKLLLGIAIYLVWIIGWTVTAGVMRGWEFAVVILLGMPVIGIGGLLIRERSRWARDDIRRFFLLRSRRELIETLAARQRDLASRMEIAFQTFVHGS